MSDNMVITIERQYASGGLEIGKNLSQKLNIPFYSREIVEMAAERCDIPKEYLESTQEKCFTKLFIQTFSCRKSRFN